jgi:hypothetical protein
VPPSSWMGVVILHHFLGLRGTSDALATSSALATGTARLLIGLPSLRGGVCGWGLGPVGWGQRCQAPCWGPGSQGCPLKRDLFVVRSEIKTQTSELPENESAISRVSFVGEGVLDFIKPSKNHQRPFCQIKLRTRVQRQRGASQDMWAQTLSLGL